MGKRPDHFWDLIERVDANDRVDGSMAGVLAVELARLPVPQIAQFHRSVMVSARRALTWDLWEAADIIHRAPCSQDTFCYFRLWLISQGREVFESAIGNPDSLADHPPILRLAQEPLSRWQNSDYPHMEDLLHGAEMAYDRVMDKIGPAMAAKVDRPEELEEVPQEIPDEAPPSGFGDERRIRQRYPNLVRLFSWM
ncbi:DUF4240 domain-containing protein [Actinomadura sp. 3N508]|uniref:DUF4240 domain-containing protein n=1 Tax=Actinomadura sp. 3N508 TaxID=3375153 RepID=UPI003798B97F